jgi:hypothetical protein
MQGGCTAKSRALADSASAATFRAETRKFSSHSLAAKIIGKEVTPMKNEYTAVVKQEDDWWVGWIEEVPGVNCQEKTYEELKETLVVTLREAL